MNDMSPQTLWMVLVGLLVIAEMLTGTFYLLMLVWGAVAGEIAALLNADIVWQIVLAAVTGIVSTTCWHLYARSRRKKEAPASANPNVLIDIGSEVVVNQADLRHSGLVTYRGTLWSAKLASGEALARGRHRIVSLDRNQLVLERI
jgi:membrane protein implicated in regulation of membrane protease activity